MMWWVEHLGGIYTGRRGISHALISVQFFI